MAWYKHKQFVEPVDEAIFDFSSPPGQSAPAAGIYKCTGCGREIAIARGHTLPPQSHHDHRRGQGDILWRLIVGANHNPT